MKSVLNRSTFISCMYVAAIVSLIAYGAAKLAESYPAVVDSRIVETG